MAQELIEASPTKKLFIDTLTQDISVRACILDLIDNSIDSYIRYKISERRLIHLKFSKDLFYLLDECGGIDKKYLKENVFQFGNSKNEFNDPILGMYGIGLKRSIFKIGKKIRIVTDDGNNYCYVEIDVDKWKMNDKDWTIPFETEASRLKGNENHYTEISITELNEEVKDKFDLVPFGNDLAETIKKVYCLMLKDQIEFKLNNTIIGTYPLLVPAANDSAQIAIEKYDDINIEIICFIDPSKGTRSTNTINQRGWNLFCNRRLILSNDTSEITGWRGGEEVKDKSMLPKYHSIYNEFRGLVFLNSNNPFKLPLNTSKTSLNTEDKNYNYILNKMVLTARPVIDFLTAKYSDEKSKGDEVENEIEQKSEGDIDQEMKEFGEIELKPQNFIAAKKIASPKNKDLVRISYTKSKRLVDKAMQHLSVNTAKEMGERTFEYFIKMEEIENE